MVMEVMPVMDSHCIDSHTMDIIYSHHPRYVTSGADVVQLLPVSIIYVSDTNEKSCP